MREKIQTLRFGGQMSNVKTYPILLILIVLLSLFIYKEYSQSILGKNQERINLVIYDQYPIFYSLGVKDRINYLIQFYPDFKIVVPGGYDQYRVGALAKLVELEKNSQIFKKGFSGFSLSFVDFYFYKKSSEIYYGGKRESNFNDITNNIWKIFYYRSNANLIDRIYLFSYLLRTKKQEIVFLKLKPFEDFFHDYQGSFFQQIYRLEKETIQIIYSKNYKTANLISQIIEGNGMRVVDLSEREMTDQCLVTAKDQPYSLTAKKLADFFHCQLKKGTTEISDIIFKLGRLEKEWEIK